MISLFDIHSESGRMALLRSDLYGHQWLELRSIEGQVLGEIPNEYLPLGPHWSPDGATIAFGSNDGILYLYHLGEEKPKAILAPSTLQAGFCEWSKDGKRLVYSAYGRNMKIPPNIYYLEVDSGHTHQLTDDPHMVDRFPHWSPSGQYIAFHRQNMEEAEHPMRVFTLDIQSGNCFPLLDNQVGSCRIGRIGWTPDSSSILITISQKDKSEIKVIRLEDHAPLWSYKSKTLQSGVISPKGDRILAIGSDELLWFEYPEGKLIDRLPLESLSPVRISFTGPQVGFSSDATALNFLGENSYLYRWVIGGECECILEDDPQVRPACSHETYSIPSLDGRPVPVERFIPPEPKLPAILYVHGGPGEAIDPDDPFMLRLLAEGYEFVCTAYRGSRGYGEEHQEANRGEYGRGDVRDIVAAGLDWKKRFGENRPLILMGYSYGGFLTFLSLAQEKAPWAGGVVLWPVTSMLRFGLHQQRAFPTDPDQRKVAMVERSPVEQAGRIRVPLMIFHGALDTVATTEELRSIQNKIIAQGGECDLIVFEDDTHGLMRHRDEIHERVLSFLNAIS